MILNDLCGRIAIHHTFPHSLLYFPILEKTMSKKAGFDTFFFSIQG